MNETISNCDIGQTGYVHFGTYPEGGYTCPICGAWVNYNDFHCCWPNQSYCRVWVNYRPFQPDYTGLLTEIKDLLGQLIKLLG